MAEAQPRPNSGRAIVALVSEGKISPAQAEQLLQEIHPVKAKILGHMKRDNFVDRQAVAERSSHGIGFVVYGLIGLAHGVADATLFAAGEVVELTTFGVSRIITRGIDGINRGRSQLDKGNRP